MGYEWDRMVELLRGVTFENGRIVDSTLPSVAVARGKRLTDAMRDGYGDLGIEDLWTEFFCVSTDLTEGEVHVHTTGPVWEAVRSSIAIPGVLPPMRSARGHVLVDGGVLDNVPTAAMKDTYAPKTLIAIDLRARSTIEAADLGSRVHLRMEGRKAPVPAVEGSPRSARHPGIPHRSVDHLGKRHWHRRRPDHPATRRPVRVHGLRCVR